MFFIFWLWNLRSIYLKKYQRIIQDVNSIEQWQPCLSHWIIFFCYFWQFFFLNLSLSPQFLNPEKQCFFSDEAKIIKMSTKDVINLLPSSAFLPNPVMFPPCLGQGDRKGCMKSGWLSFWTLSAPSESKYSSTVFQLSRVCLLVSTQSSYHLHS